MSAFFLQIVNMSISASWIVLAVLLLRSILKEVPKWTRVLLWGIVAVRLICPFSLESDMSLIPSAETFPQEVISGPSFDVQTGIAPVDDRVNEYLGDRYFEGVTVPANNGAATMTVLSVIWLMGVLVLAAYIAISYWHLCRSVDTAVRLRGKIFQHESIDSPFVLGILRPRIYLPLHINEQELEHVIAHEEAHILRKDHWWKPLGFLLLTIHWFNPLMWVAYIMLCRDIELACDEKVIKNLNSNQRADYSQALVACSISRRQITVCPLAFGEVGVKDRVKSVMNYRKPGFWLITASVILCVISGICFLTNPPAPREFALNGRNVSSLNTNLILEKITEAEKLEDSSQLNVNADNFDLMLTSGFDWADDGAIRFFYAERDKTYSAQLRMFHEDKKCFVTERTEWVNQNRIFKLRHFLEALKYLPQEEIRQLSPEADRYSVMQADYGTPADFIRVLTYSADGVMDLDGWYIHLAIQPLYEVDGAYNGLGSEVIHLFYGVKDLVMLESSSLICRIDSDGQPPYIAPAYYVNGFDWDYENLPQVEMSSSGKLVFTVNWDTDELLVGENYYERTGPDSTMIHQETCTLTRNSDGEFELDVNYRNPGTEEEGVYFIKDESGQGKYVMKVLFRDSADSKLKAG